APGRLAGPVDQRCAGEPPEPGLHGRGPPFPGGRKRPFGRPQKGQVQVRGAGQGGVTTACSPHSRQTWVTRLSPIRSTRRKRQTKLASRKRSIPVARLTAPSTATKPACRRLVRGSLSQVKPAGTTEK